MISASLSAWGTGSLDVPEHVQAATLRHLLDGIGTALGGMRSGAVDAVVTVARELGGPPEASVLGVHGLIGAPGAALANGALVHALDFDDTHAGGLVHATAVVLPAAFAVAQQTGASGRQVLDAATVGYEIVCRVAAAAPHGFHARGIHATMVAGVFSSAVVAARLLGLDAVTAANALGIAGSQAGGLLAFLNSGASTKKLHPGFASHSGILAARLAAAGATGPESVFEGPHGVYDALTDGPVDLASVDDGLGTRWETTRIGIKPYPVCQLSHATLDAMAHARANTPFSADEIESVVAEVHPNSASTVCDDRRDLARPESAYAAKFSLPWSVAAMVVDGQVQTSTFAPESITRPEVESLARRVSWRLTDGSGHAADAAGAVHIILRDGREVHGSVSCSAGGPDDPLSRDQLIAKFLANAGEEAGPLISLIEDLRELESLDPLFDAAAALFN